MIDRLISVPHLNQSQLLARWQKFIKGEPVESQDIFEETYQGWQRCLAMGINPYKIKIKCLSEAELQYRKVNLHEICRLLEPHLQTIVRAVSTHSDRYFITVADHEGYVIEVYSDKES
ncbi:MAG: PAS domain-containing sensor histidine kinase, partial [Firmicutes bacterium]|nr:PAS domain-containing sensor histidine kinase [Bacillota bacterium]